jgi:hypothetical protein
VDATKIDDNHVYEQTYEVSTLGVQYKVRVSETLYLINYNNWFLPTVKRRIYKADLKYLVNGKVVKAFTDYYPLLGLGVMALDPLYPLLMVAYKHLDIFLTKEHKL